MTDQNFQNIAGDDLSRQGAQMRDEARNGAQSRDSARNDALMREVSRQGAQSRDSMSYTLSVDGAVELMAAGGFPRSKRAIQRFCQLGHLECSRVATELGEKYFITRESVERRIKELEQIHVLTTAGVTGRDTMRHDDGAALRDESRQAAQGNDMAPSVAPLRDEARNDASSGAEDLVRLQHENEKLKALV